MPTEQSSATASDHAVAIAGQVSRSPITVGNRNLIVNVGALHFRFPLWVAIPVVVLWAIIGVLLLLSLLLFTLPPLVTAPPTPHLNRAFNVAMTNFVVTASRTGGLPNSYGQDLAANLYPTVQQQLKTGVLVDDD